jgi:hypothetical protein
LKTTGGSCAYQTCHSTAARTFKMTTRAGLSPVRVDRTVLLLRVATASLRKRMDAFQKTETRHHDVPLWHVHQHIMCHVLTVISLSFNACRLPLGEP